MKNLTLTIAAALLCLFGTSTALAQGKGAVVEEVELSAFEYNECCDEWIEISGRANTVWHEKTGKYHLNFKGVNATGSQGNTYRGNWVYSETYSASDDGTSVTEIHAKATLVSKSGCRLSIRAVIVITRSPENGTTREVRKLDIRCDGPDVE